MQAQHEEGCGKGARGHRRIAAFEPPEGVAADKEPCRHVGGGDGAFAAGEREIASEFAEGVSGGDRKRIEGCHGYNVC